MKNNEAIEKAITITGSQSKLAKLSGVSQSAIHKLLTRKSKNPSVGTLKALSKASGMPMNDFTAD